MIHGNLGRRFSRKAASTNRSSVTTRPSRSIQIAAIQSYLAARSPGKDYARPSNTIESAAQPTFPEALNSLGSVQLEQGDFKSAIAVRGSSPAKPEFADAFSNLAGARRTRRYGESQPLLSRGAYGATPIFGALSVLRASPRHAAGEDLAKMKAFWSANTFPTGSALAAPRISSRLRFDEAIRAGRGARGEWKRASPRGGPGKGRPITAKLRLRHVPPRNSSHPSSNVFGVGFDTDVPVRGRHAAIGHDASRTDTREPSARSRSRRTGNRQGGHRSVAEVAGRAPRRRSASTGLREVIQQAGKRISHGCTLHASARES